MRFIILVMVFLVMSCHANDRRLASDTEENINVCSRSNVMEELQCLNAKNIELQEKLRELGNNEKTDYQAWSNTVTNRCEHLNLRHEGTPQGEVLGVLKQLCYYQEYNSRLGIIKNNKPNQTKKVVKPLDNNKDSSDFPSITEVKIKVGNGQVVTYKTLPLPISSTLISACEAGSDKKSPICSRVVHYGGNDDALTTRTLLEISQAAHAPMSTENFAWILPTRDGLVFFIMYREDSGDNWFLISRGENGTSRFYDFGFNSLFHVDRNLKITIKNIEKKEVRQYQVENNGEISELGKK